MENNSPEAKQPADLWYPLGWEGFFSLPEYEPNRQDFARLMDATRQYASEAWAQNDVELKRRWQVAIERVALIGISTEDRESNTELENVELATIIVVTVVLEEEKWDEEGLAFAVFNMFVGDPDQDGTDPEAPDIEAAAVIDLRQL